MKKWLIDNEIKGIAAAPGISIAKAFLYTREIESVSHDSITEVDEAVSNLREALEKSKKELNKVFSLAVDKLGNKRAAIFEAQLMILDDPILIANLFDRIKKEKLNPEFIVHDEITKYQNMMNESTESYMKERSQDIEDIKNRIIRNLKHKKWHSRISNDVIIVAHSISPADTVLFSRVNTKGYITNVGGLTSHAAIVARSLGIPAVVGVHDGTSKINEGDLVIIDGYHGVIYVKPVDEQINYYSDKIERLNELDTELLKLKDEPAVTTDGYEVKILANLDVNAEIEFIFQNGAKGIGLIRTEQLFNVLENFPDESLQYTTYKELAEKLYPQKITIRAFDIGGDKVLPVDVKEPNPMLGWRGIRFLLDHKELFKTQIKAVLRASVHGNVNFMIPMVSSIREVLETRKLIDECMSELKSKKKNYDKDIDFGIMIEVPSAALMINDFSEYVDFFSIGTNDLIQYLLAVDRGNDIISNQYQEYHPAVVRALEFILKDAKKNKKPVSICGEMASHHTAVPLILGLGFDAISVNAASIPQIKKIIRKMSYQKTKELVEECLLLKTENEIKTKIKLFYDSNYDEDIEQIFDS